MHQASTCGPVPQSPGPTPSAQKLWYLDVMLRIMNPVSQMATDEIQEEKYYRESINIKTRVSVTVSALTGSVPRKISCWRQRVSAPCGNRTHLDRLTATHLNHKTMP